MKKFFILFCLLLTLVGCKTKDPNFLNKTSSEVKIAFMPDVHFHDVYAEFQDESFKGIYSKTTEKSATIRTMESQLNSTRLFNENYFAFIAALDDIKDKGIKYVVFPGDFSDDGQPINVRGFKKILDDYSKKYGMEFLITFGNHDPARPFEIPGGKKDYLGANGQKQPISSNGMYKKDNLSNPPIVSEEVKFMGYEGLFNEVGKYGLYPQEQMIYWETPFSTYNGDNYSFEKAVKESNLSKRSYLISQRGSEENLVGKEYLVPDGSYLVEPTEGVWLLVVDSNVYIPKETPVDNNPENGSNFNGSGNAGFNAVITHKSHLITWMKDVAKRAEKNNKVLITTGHFPAVDFYNDAAEEIEDIFGIGNFQLKRNPKETTSKILAEIGIKVNVAGHMHFNDTGMKKYSDDEFIFNVQSPSLSAYIPAYKVLTVKDKNTIDVDTIMLDEVPRFDELFEYYQTEYDYLDKLGYDNIWNKDILTSKNYYEFSEWHIKELVRLRFLPKEWPEDIKEMIFKLNGKEMLILSQLETEISLDQWSNVDFKNTPEWVNAEDKAENLLNKDESLEDYENWSGFDLITDFYKLRNADSLALKDISLRRIEQYKLLSKVLSDTDIKLVYEDNKVSGENSISNVFQKRFNGIFSIMLKFSTDLPSENFTLDIKNGTITKR
ncbi:MULTISPECIES: metallophosphoesterase family protein [Psychrilyobacter]|uniref:Metallophosphoesterase n=3 Tax=Psychrilyobacter TaxID=623282 RepID=A0ABX9KGN5_9FUSO|nr:MULTISPECIES: metallophosphoesterase [Psychrilyobacter]NDI77712.1 metallophosphoesterase [Psychrilyobacter piezotolerans]RDE61412.1 metallophosphoesterase [Psychrilyobacter sp. S5]REI40933.1 metallophosphoesterase [Psychrilyobacter piezotolerans]